MSKPTRKVLCWEKCLRLGWKRGQAANLVFLFNSEDVTDLITRVILDAKTVLQH